jgi:hypothetical protein
MEKVKSENVWNGKEVETFLLSNFKGYMHKWFSNLPLKSCDNEDWKAVKQNLLRRFVNRYHWTNENEYFLDNNNESSKDEEPAADFPLPQDSQICGTFGEVKMSPKQSVSEQETEEAQAHDKDDIWDEEIMFGTPFYLYYKNYYSQLGLSLEHLSMVINLDHECGCKETTSQHHLPDDCYV